MSKQNRIELSHWTSTESMFHLHRKFSVKQFTEVEATNYYRLIFYQITKLEYMYNLLLCSTWNYFFIFYRLAIPFHFSSKFHCVSHRRMNFSEGLSGFPQSTAAVKVALVDIVWMSMLTWKEFGKSRHCMKKCHNLPDG